MTGLFVDRAMDLIVTIMVMIGPIRMTRPGPPERRRSRLGTDEVSLVQTRHDFGERLMAYGEDMIFEDCQPWTNGMGDAMFEPRQVK